MIANFFQSLSAHEVQYLLISGQAAVLYGAAVFSEDIDIWISPLKENCVRLVESLAELGAKYYKLTPPVSPAYVERGHGFHFVVGEEDDVFFLDVMGCPPRVPPFEQALRDSRVVSTDWGGVPTVGIRDLVEIKKTQRASDYPVIGQLVLRDLEDRDRPTEGDYRWAAENMFTLPELRQLLQAYPETVEIEGTEPLFGKLASALMSDELPTEETEQDIERLLTERTLAHQAADRRYWREIIVELRELRQKGELIPVGAPVVPLPI